MDHHPVARSHLCSTASTSALLQGSLLVQQENELDEALCGDVAVSPASNLVPAKHDDGGKKAARKRKHASVAGKLSQDKRAIIRNPKYVSNPKWQSGWSPALPGSPIPVVSTKAAPTPTQVLTLPAPPYATCNPPYTNTAAGAVYGPGLGTFPMLPRPTTFVTRNGSQLYLDGEPWQIAGPNIYWLGLDENPYIAYPDKGRIREAMAMAAAMGANTIRSHSLGISTGRTQSLWPQAQAVNYNAYDTIDYSIWAARNYGLRLIIVLTDEYKYYHGGKYDFLGWAGADTSNGYNFYLDGYTRYLYKEYIATLLTHVNTYTGVALQDDPTILGWETINEGGAWMLQNGAPTTEWTTDIANYIKSFAPTHMVIDGTNGLFDVNGNFRHEGLNIDAVDIVTDHFYPAALWLLYKDQNWLANYNKVYFVGEMDWTGTHGGDDLHTFYQAIENWPGAGSMIWSLFGHDAQCCNYVQHNDGYSCYYPNGVSASLQSRELLIVQHWNRLRGLKAPTSMPAVACPQPALLP